MGCCFSFVQAQPSVLQSGKWYKVAVEKNGVYKIDRDLFKKMGFDPAKTDPRKIKIYGNGGGMLPQANNAIRPVDLTENAIHIQGESDGVFHSADYILFYAQGADKISFNQSKGIFSYENNLYSDKNYYFITVDETNGKRIATANVIAGAFPVVNEFENFFYYELDSHSELKSGRDWYGERFDPTLEFEKDVPLNNVVAGSTIKFVSDIMTQSFSTSSFKVFLNNVEVVQQTTATITNTQYGIKGRDRRDTVTISANAIAAPGKSSQKVKYQYVKAASGRSIGYLDYFLVQATQTLQLSGQQTSFRSLSSINNPVSKFEIAGTSAQSIVWDVTDADEPIAQPVTFASGITSFTAVSSSLKEYVVIASSPSPELIGSVSNQNIRQLPVPELIIVTHPDVKSEAIRFANHRTNNGISAAVVTVQEIYNEFSSGRQDVTAIRDFVKSLHDRAPGTLKSLLLFGKCSYDYKKRVIDNINLVPIYESRNSLHPLLTYSSDDYYTFLESNEGFWGEDPAVNHTMDISVGRFPVRKNSEAKNVVDKIIRYESDASLMGKWQKDIVFIADDGDFNEHQDDADQLAESLKMNHADFDIKKIYLDSYLQESRPSGEVSEQTRKKIEEAFSTGALVINYTGHGAERLWAQERIFDELSIARMENQLLPLLVTATCEFGRQDDPIFPSGAELCLFKEKAGAISLVSTSRPVNANTNFLLNQAFYAAFFEKENDQYLSLGEIFRRTKNNSAVGVANRNFSLIGDPSLFLAMPQYKMKVNEIITASGSSTLKALSKVTVKGEVLDTDNVRVENFNGVLEATLFDKQTNFLTLGDQNQPYPYKEWFSVLFRGKAKVEAGEFEFQFVIPKNIDYQIDEGKLSLFAYDLVNKKEASGFTEDFEIGSTELNPTPDLTAPTLRVFMGDTTFVNGGIVNPNTTLVARLFDQHGINISGYGVGNSVIGILDNDAASFVLNDFYMADVDDYTRGTISYPLTDLSPGRHTIHVKAWDVYNNPVQGKVDFLVTDGSNLAIEAFENYPNPFRNSTTLFFTHNRSGDHLEANLALYDYTGQFIESYQIDIPESSYQVELLTINRYSESMKNRPAGLYFARLSVRSLSNGSKNEQVTKLIISN